MARATLRLSRGFRALWAGSAISNTGDGIRLAALPLLAVELTESAILVSAVTAASFLPWLIVAPVAGAMVDRSDRRQLILRTQLVRAAVMIALAALVAADLASVWSIYLVAFVITVGEILVDPSIVALVPTLVDDDELDPANGRLAATETVTNEFAGAPIGSLAFVAAPWLPFAIDGASYALSTERFRHLPPPPASPVSADPVDDLADAPARPSVRDDAREGFRYLWRHPILRPVALAIAWANIGSIASVSLLVLLITVVLDGSELAYGVMLAVGAVGAVVGSLLTGYFGRFDRRIVLTVFSLVQAGAIVAMGAAPNVPVAIALWFLAALPAGVMIPLMRSLQQRITPNHMLGRVNTTARIMTRGSLIFGALGAGALASLTSVRMAIVVGGLVMLTAAPLLALAVPNGSGSEGLDETEPPRPG